MGEPAGHQWVGRPVVALSVRVAARVVPLAASVGVAYAVASTVPQATTVPLMVGRFVAIAAVATLVLFGVDRLARRLLPLAALFDLTLAFPDQAPSRYRIALRSGGPVALRQRLDDYVAAGDIGPAAAAERLIELVGVLSRHDRLTRGHSERVRAYSQVLGAELGLDADELDRIKWAGLIHDIGKLRVPTEILNKPGRLTDEEFEIVKRHPADGAALAAPLASWLGTAVLAVSQHHERWDGRGYPAGLAGHDISLAGRLVAVADAYDVMTSARSYKRPMSPAAARAELTRCAGTQFDPAIVRAFVGLSIGRLRFAMGPLSWLTQASLFPQALFGIAATPIVSTLTVATGLTAASIASATSVPPVVDERPAVVAPATASVGSADAAAGGVDAPGAGRDAPGQMPHAPAARELPGPTGGVTDPLTDPVNTSPGAAPGPSPGNSVPAGPSTSVPAGGGGDTPTVPPTTVPGLPGVSIPPVSVPDVPIPTVTVPVVSLPPVVVTVPSVSVPTISLPPVSVPPVELPGLGTITVPVVTVPPISVPITTPPISLPPISLPPISVPPVSLPPLTLPPITIPGLLG